CQYSRSYTNLFFYYFNITVHTELYTLSLHDALPILRFDIKPRYYDPVREEIEQRTSQIRKDLEAQGFLEKSDGSSHDIGSYGVGDRKSTRLNSSHVKISYAVFCLKKKNNIIYIHSST